MKKSKLNLGKLKVKSFVTQVGKDKENTLKGGGHPTTWCTHIILCTMEDPPPEFN